MSEPDVVMEVEIEEVDVEDIDEVDVDEVDVDEVDDVNDVDDEVQVKGIWASTVATGDILKISESFSQQAKLPTPQAPVSQQYSVVDVIAPLQNLIPAVERLA